MVFIQFTEVKREVPNLTYNYAIIVGVIMICSSASALHSGPLLGSCNKKDQVIAWCKRPPPETQKSAVDNVDLGRQMA